MNILVFLPTALLTFILSCFCQFLFFRLIVCVCLVSVVVMVMLVVML